MPYDRPNLGALRDQAQDDINAALPGVDARLRYSNEAVIAEVLAGLANGHYGYLDWIALNAVPFTATGEFLEGWAALKKVYRKPASYATGSAEFPATADANIPSGTVIARSDGATYTTTADADEASGTITVELRADVAGVDGNADDSTAMQLLAGVSGVTGAGSASGAITGGADVETDADLRTRMLQRYAAPPQGGAVTDYPGWALEVPGVTRAWLKRNAMGPGSLAILFMMDDAQAAHDGFPQGTDGCSTYEPRATPATGDQLTVANYIFPLQSTIALVYAVAPIPNALTITVAGLTGASDALKTAISTACAAALRGAGVPGGITYLSVLEAAIAAVPGSTGFVITNIACSAGSIIGGGAAGNVQSADGALATIDELIFS
jgi:uncharacterized phage protein gp47/JayE